MASAPPTPSGPGGNRRGHDVTVFARFRPALAAENERDPRTCAEFVSEDTVACVNSEEGSRHSFTFSKVWNMETSQEQLYQRVGAPVVEDVLNGYNGTVFAYGQTGSGKTYTMLGPSLSASGTTLKEQGTDRRATSSTSQALLDEALTFDLRGENAGIVPRAVHDLYRRIDEADEEVKFEVAVSYVEIYMERVRDLLDPSKTNLQLREDIPNRRFYVDKCTTLYATSAEEVFELIERGTRNRATATTRVNELSSRSHSIVSISVRSINEKTCTQLTGKLFLVDLAGSEKVSKTHASGLQLDEAKLINKSLTTLSLVISNLIDRDATHIPYRDSKLTRLLQDSLGGNARTSLIVCCSPSFWNMPETMSTLRFGSWATRVENHAVVNKELTMDELKGMLAKAEEEIRELRKKGGGAMTPTSDAAPRSIEAARQDAAQLVLVERRCNDLESKVAALREAADEGSQREALAMRKADALAAVVGTYEEELEAWQDHYARLTRQLAAETECGVLLKSTLHEAHNSCSAAQEEIQRLQKQVDSLSVAAPAAAVAPGTPRRTASAQQHADPNASMADQDADAAEQRCAALESQLAVLQDQWRDAVNDGAAAKIELEFALKRLAIRNERIENLKNGLKNEKLNLQDARVLRETEARKHASDLAAAREEANHWRAETERLRDVLTQYRTFGTGGPQPSNPSSRFGIGTPSPGSNSRFLRSLRGNGPRTPQTPGVTPRRDATALFDATPQPSGARRDVEEGASASGARRGSAVRQPQLNDVSSPQDF